MTVKLVERRNERTLAPLIPWSCLQYRFVKMRSWSLSPPYRRTGASATVANVRRTENEEDELRAANLLARSEDDVSEGMCVDDRLIL